MSAMRYNGRHSHWRRRRRPTGVTQLLRAASRVPPVPPSLFSSTWFGKQTSDRSSVQLVYWHWSVGGLGRRCLACPACCPQPHAVLPASAPTNTTLQTMHACPALASRFSSAAPSRAMHCGPAASLLARGALAPPPASPAPMPNVSASCSTRPAASTWEGGRIGGWVGEPSRGGRRCARASNHSCHAVPCMDARTSPPWNHTD